MIFDPCVGAAVVPDVEGVMQRSPRITTPGEIFVGWEETDPRRIIDFEDRR